MWPMLVPRWFWMGAEEVSGFYRVVVDIGFRAIWLVVDFWLNVFACAR